MTRKRLTVALVAALGGGFITAEADAQEGSRSAVLQVFVLDRAGVPNEVLDSATRETTRTLEHAGVELRWPDCSGNASLKPSVCTEPLGPSHLKLRIIAPRNRKIQRTSTGAGPNIESLGEAICVEVGKGSYATIFYGSVNHIAGGSAERMARALGYVMAHEIGHLLGCQHSTGVMTPGAGDLLKLSPEEALFSATDRKRVSEYAAKRAGPGVSSRMRDHTSGSAEIEQ